jgi:hypothetical protein
VGLPACTSLLSSAKSSRSRAGLADAFGALLDGYRTGAAFEDAARLEARAAALLPGLLLARIDGKSPVDYIEREADRERVRAIARPRVAEPPARLEQVREAMLRGLPA